MSAKQKYNTLWKRVKRDQDKSDSSNEHFNFQILFFITSLVNGEKVMMRAE